MSAFRYGGLILATAMAVGGCVAAQAEVARSGFLDDYERLQPNPDFPGSSDWVNTNAAAGPTTGLIIDPVSIRLGPGLIKDGVQPDPELLDAALKYLHQALVREFAAEITVVDRPGKGVVRYRAAITGITTEGGLTSSATNLLPLVFVLRTATGKNDLRAKLYMEAEYSDSLTGMPLGATMQSAAGGAVVGDENARLNITLEHLAGVID